MRVSNWCCSQTRDFDGDCQHGIIYININVMQRPHFAAHFFHFAEMKSYETFGNEKSTAFTVISVLLFKHVILYIILLAMCGLFCGDRLPFWHANHKMRLHDTHTPTADCVWRHLKCNSTPDFVASNRATFKMKPTSHISTKHAIPKCLVTLIIRLIRPDKYCLLYIIHTSTN